MARAIAGSVSQWSPHPKTPSAPDGPGLAGDVVHGEVGGVARRQASINARGGGGDQAVGLVKGDPSSGELPAPLSSATSFGRAQRCTPQAAHQPLCDGFFAGKQSAPDLLDRDRTGPRFVTLAAQSAQAVARRTAA